MTKEETQLIAKEMFKGNDKIFEKHMKAIKKLFETSKGI
jgi:hypothetical protein